MKAKLPRNETTTALVCSLDFIPLAPENSFNKATVSYPRKKLSFIKHTGNSQKQVIEPLKQSNEEGG